MAQKEGINFILVGHRQFGGVGGGGSPQIGHKVSDGHIWLVAHGGDDGPSYFREKRLLLDYQSSQLAHGLRHAAAGQRLAPSSKRPMACSKGASPRSSRDTISSSRAMEPSKFSFFLTWKIPLQKEWPGIRP